MISTKIKPLSKLKEEHERSIEKQKEINKEVLKKVPLLVSFNSQLIRIAGQSKKTYIGYNIFNESLVEVSKDKAEIVPDYVYQLLKSQDNRITVALHMYNGCTIKAAGILDIGREMIRKTKTKLDIFVYKGKG